MRTLVFLLLVVSILFQFCSKEEADEYTGCNNSNPVEKGNRMLGMDILDATETGSFEENVQKGADFGMDFTALHLTWSSIETGKMEYTDPGQALASFDAFLDAGDLKFSLTIRPIDLTGKTVPTDLEDNNFNDAEMIARFQSLMDFVFHVISYEHLTSLQVGNEIDGYNTSSESPDFWSDYAEFLGAIRTYASTQYPGLKIGFTGTFHGLVGSTMAKDSVFHRLADQSDVLGVTYYPNGSGFKVQDPIVVFEDMADLTEMYAPYPIYLQELGYQTSVYNGSSESRQAEFFCNFFKVWDQYPTEIPLVNIVRMNDVSEDAAQDMAGPYGLSDKAFTEYLRTLGVRTYEGEDKRAFEVIVEQAKLRNW